MIVGERDDPDTEAMIAAARRGFNPNRIVALIEPKEGDAIDSKLPLFEGRRMIDGRTDRLCLPELHVRLAGDGRRGFDGAARREQLIEINPVPDPSRRARPRILRIDAARTKRINRPHEPPMPLYDYKCENGHVFEVMQSFSSEPVAMCDDCGISATRQISIPMVVYKGSGFYTTDYGRKRFSVESEFEIERRVIQFRIGFKREGR